MIDGREMNGVIEVLGEFVEYHLALGRMRHKARDLCAGTADRGTTIILSDFGHPDSFVHCKNLRSLWVTDSAELTSWRLGPYPLHNGQGVSLSLW